MRCVTKIVSTRKFLWIGAVLVCWQLALPTALQAQCTGAQGNNAVYNTMCNGGSPGVVGSSAFIDAYAILQAGHGLAFGADRKLYGTTLNGGPGPGGTVFRLAPPSRGSKPWKEAILYGFSGNGGGLDPECTLIFDVSGNLYGTTLDSSGTYYGTVFRLTPPQRKGGTWTLNLLYGFRALPDGGQPAAGVVFDKDGNLYGTTTEGGSGTGCSFYGCGTVFEISP